MQFFAVGVYGLAHALGGLTAGLAGRQSFVETQLGIERCLVAALVFLATFARLQEFPMVVDEGVARVAREAVGESGIAGRLISIELPQRTAEADGAFGRALDRGDGATVSVRGRWHGQGQDDPGQKNGRFQDGHDGHSG
jgi:hypothetical protein